MIHKRHFKIAAVCTLSALLIFTGCSGKSADLSELNSETSEDAVYTGSLDEFDVDEYYDSLLHCVEQIQEKTDFVPDIVLVLGSGLGHFADNIEVAAEINYSEIEGFPQSTVEGHEGELIFGTCKGQKIVAMNGRVHFY